MASYRLLTYAEAGVGGAEPRPGLLLVESRVVVDLRRALAEERATVLSLLEDWDRARPRLEALADEGSKEHGAPLASVRLLAPILYPGAYWMAAANYHDHHAEMNPDRPPIDKTTTRPYFFLKAGRHNTLGPDEPVRYPRTSQKMDWEAELGAVIGRPARDVSVASALDYVAGYTICNDLSLRDLARRTDWSFGSDWLGQKNFDGGIPVGPWITPASEVADPQDLRIKLWVNDELMQDQTTGQMVFDVREQIAYLSEQITLLPGDVIATGTPSGVGRPRGIFLKPGDEVRITIGDLGTLRNPIVGSEGEGV